MTGPCHETWCRLTIGSTLNVPPGGIDSAPISAQRTRTSTGGTPAPANALDAPTSHPLGFVSLARTCKRMRGMRRCRSSAVAVAIWNRSPRSVVSTATLPAAAGRKVDVRARSKAKMRRRGRGSRQDWRAESARAESAGLSASSKPAPSWLPIARTGRPPESMLAGAVIGAGNDPAGKGAAAGNAPALAGGRYPSSACSRKSTASRIGPAAICARRSCTTRQRIADPRVRQERQARAEMRRPQRDQSLHQGRIRRGKCPRRHTRRGVRHQRHRRSPIQLLHPCDEPANLRVQGG